MWHVWGGDRPDALRGKTVAVYFSAHWCGPCQQFTPVLARLYNEVQRRTPDFEVVFVSADRTRAEFDGYFQEMPWLALSYERRATKNSLMELLGVGGYPTLVLFGPEGELLTKDGTNIVRNDPSGAAFPWAPTVTEAARVATQVLLCRSCMPHCSVLALLPS